MGTSGLPQVRHRPISATRADRTASVNSEAWATLGGKVRVVA
ncbi:MAG TPA: hypothetical protein VFJ85_12335 [Acidimicrobiales bacterium]|nr:hypothetical protein [Acidimicrobiales bacterium]